MPAARSDRRVFWYSLAVYPVASALWLLWVTLTYGTADAEVFDYLNAILISLAVAAALPVPVLIWAAYRRKPLQALAGLAFGAIAAVIALPLSMELVGSRRYGQFEHDKAQFAAFQQTVRGGDRARIRAQLRALPGNFSAPHALCALGGGATYTFERWLWFNDHAYGEPLPSKDLHTAATAVVEGDWPRAEKQAALLTVLRYLLDREETTRFPAWARLWRATLEQPDAPGATLFDPDYEGDYGGCDLGDPADPVFRRWHDEGLRMWMQAGFGFAGEQHRWALHAVRSKAMLDALFAADPTFATLLGSEHYLGQEALSAQVDDLSARLDRSERPGELADLVEALAKASVDPTRSVSGVSPCRRFDQAEAQRDASKDSPQRRAAAARIRSQWCPAGLKAPVAAAKPPKAEPEPSAPPTDDAEPVPQP
ncbi:hypothetical protein [Lysobacter capsici]|uniref:hypothetical protein n=1 Tax=Lysobacter capsici TaxID=435897 RepID=UPI001C00634A|nr:hypothetical protein [Lysobacter capsici]QWF16798.1 hypothetical protein KME82_24175 [Lysobacter capsici]